MFSETLDFSEPPTIKVSPASSPTEIHDILASFSSNGIISKSSEDAMIPSTSRPSLPSRIGEAPLASRSPSPKPVPETKNSPDRKRRRLMEDTEDELLQTILRKMKGSDDEFLTWAKVVSNDLSKLEHKQALIAKKIISDAVFYGSMNMLRPDSTVTNLCDPDD